MPAVTKESELRGSLTEAPPEFVQDQSKYNYVLPADEIVKTFVITLRTVRNGEEINHYVARVERSEISDAGLTQLAEKYVKADGESFRQAAIEVARICDNEKPSRPVGWPLRR